ncbi:GTPase HflX [candidate division KSB3 bacterium]|uniref:GTPase HflX n=1 Tax=candidate division KSB3 bacterium TaxID=2044937 RepID=A0A2G6E4C4_9BACT|nr:MAG: GTPase HflX [candidate division KSB3 bacterium]PIE29500.1 MAG: GTPase HflX [candidate division KSB3 bacterium]
MRKIYGNLTGLKPHQLKALDRVYRRKIPTDQVITKELSNYLSALSLATGRQIGILADRKGHIDYVIVGSQKQIDLPEIGRFRAGHRRLRGLRYIHTHLDDSPLSRDDFVDLALLRFDLIAAISVNKDGLPEKYYLAHLVPDHRDTKRWEVLEPILPQQLGLDFGAFIRALEEEFRRRQGALDVPGRGERTVLAGVSTGKRSLAEDSLNELHDLAESAGLHVMDSIIQQRPRIDPKFLIGKGKLNELIIRSYQVGAEVIVFDHDLTPAQAKLIGDMTELKIIDRSQLILDIFAQRAHSRAGKVQVELAQLKYRLPRLAARDDALSRISGGIGARGPGETRLEIDRRRARDRIRNLEKELKHLQKGRQQRRARRTRHQVPVISIVGYTNAGKSTLLNALTQSDVVVKNQMFATLDPASRRLRFPRDLDVIITDTVGFLRNLPKDLVEAFRSTLEEMEDADLLLHVVDLSNPDFEEHITTVKQILEDLQLDRIPQLFVFNKDDLAEKGLVQNVCARYDGVSICALQRSGLRKLILRVQDEILRLYPDAGIYPQLKPAAQPEYEALHS